MCRAACRIFYIRLRRVPALILTWLWVAIAIAIAWGWIHSGTAQYELSVWPGGGFCLRAESRPYGVVFTSLNHQEPPAHRAAFEAEPVGSRWEISEGVEELMTYDPEPFPGRRFGFGFAHTVVEQSTGKIAAGGWYVMQKVDCRQLAVPYTLPLVLLLLLPARHWTRYWMRLRRIDRGRCAACGYDLRGIVDRCPECGLAVPQRGKRPAGGRFVAETALGVSGLLSLLFVGHLLALPRTTPTGRVPRESSVLPFMPLWSAPVGKGPDRMIAAAQPRLPNRGQAVWKSPDGDRLIVISLFGNTMFYEFLTVWEFDRTPCLVRHGSVGVAPGSTPYELLEIRSDDADVPVRYRSKWLLAIVCWRPAQNYDPNKPVVLFNPDNRRPNEVSLALVQWNDEQPDPQNDAEKLLFAPDLKIRPAEDPSVAAPEK